MTEAEYRTGVEEIFNRKYIASFDNLPKLLREVAVYYFLHNPCYMGEIEGITRKWLLELEEIGYIKSLEGVDENETI